MRGPRHTIVAVLGIAMPVLAIAGDDAPRPLRPGDMMKLADVADPRLSPDGRVIAYTVTIQDAEADARDSDVFLVATDGGEPWPATTTAESEHSPRFSPDGRYLAFVSDREGEGSQVFLLDRRGGEAERLTEFPGGVSDLVWSPDGTRLALIVHDEDPGADEDVTPPIVVRRLQFKRDGTGYLGERRDHVYVVEVEEERTTQLSFGPYDDSEPAWSPDGRWVAFVSNRTEEPDGNQNSDVFVLPAEGQGTPRKLTGWPGADESPAFSPDGRWITYVAGGDPEHLWYGATHVAVIPFEPESDTLPESQPLTKPLDRNVSSPRFSADGRHVWFLLEDGGRQPLARVPLSGGEVERIVDGERTVSAFDVAEDGSVAVLESTPHQPNEVSLLGPEGALGRLTHVNDDFLAGIRLGKVERLRAKSADGTPVDGFVVHPPAAGAGPHPAILWLHGGPTAQYAAEFELRHQMLAAAGYLVIAPNPRGSTGYGTDFSRAIWADWGSKDYEDVVAMVDEAVARGLVDPERLGVGGWSYGGILTNHVITRTTRFKAAISGASEVNYLSNYGTDHYQYWWEQELGLPWRNTELWVRLSPFFKADAIRTPTLLLCGEDDVNVPLLNSEQLYQALRRLGRETELVIYPGQSHSIRKPSYARDRYERYLAWFDRHLTAEPAGTAEATSLNGASLIRPALAKETRERLESNLAIARAEHDADPTNADKLIWLGRRLAYLGRYGEAIATFTRGIEAHPDDLRLYRHRGHRHITTRQLDLAITDLERAAAMTEGVPDSLEPDGAPNARGIPVSTSHFNVFYHLALARYLKGDFAGAADAWERCLDFSRGSPDRLVATSDWLYVASRRAGRDARATEVLEAIHADLEVIEDQAYLDRLLLYKGERTPAELLAAAGDGEVSRATYAYGIAMFHLLNRRPERARETLEQVVTGKRWDAFAFIAAEAELVRTDH